VLILLKFAIIVQGQLSPIDNQASVVITVHVHIGMNAHSLDLEKNRRRTRLYIDAMAEMPLSIDVVDERRVLVVVVIVIMLVCRGRESWNPVSALHSSTATSRRHIFANL